MKVLLRGDTSGLAGAISWRRLEEVFRAANEIRPDEEITHYTIDDHQIIYHVRKKE